MFGKGRLFKECVVNGFIVGFGEYGRGVIWVGVVKVVVVEGVVVGWVVGCISSICFVVSKREEDFVIGLDMGDSGISLDDDIIICE